MDKKDKKTEAGLNSLIKILGKKLPIDIIRYIYIKNQELKKNDKIKKLKKKKSSIWEPAHYYEPEDPKVYKPPPLSPRSAEEFYKKNGFDANAFDGGSKLSKYKIKITKKKTSKK